MSLFSKSSLLTSTLLLTYGLFLLISPDFFMGKYIYKEGLWDDFKEEIDSNINTKNVLGHLLKGVGLTWVCWSICYFYISKSKSYEIQKKFSKVNIIVWLAWFALNQFVQYQNLYSPLASKLNFVFTFLMVVMWFVTYLF